jgi:ectoine hydroxylase-related dioxygenase (phytanoyl-CoA dioxygenase family)
LAVATDVEQGKRNLDTHGYTIHKNFLSPEQLEALRARLIEQGEMELTAGVALVSSSGHAGDDRHYSGAEGNTLPISQQIAFLPNKGVEFRAAMHHPVALEYAQHAFREAPFNVVVQGGSFLRKGGKRQVLHADQQAWPFSTPMPVMLNVLVALSDFDADMGATNIVPGSHLHPSPDLALAPEQAAAEIGSALVPMVCKAGDAMVFESRTWHCQGDSTSEKTRMVFGTVYGLHCVKPQDDYPALIHDTVYEQLSEQDREMLGFKVHFEYAGRIGPRYPGDVRRNTNAAFPYVPELHRGANNEPVVAAEGMIAIQAEKLATNVA